MRLDPITHALSSPVPDLDWIERLAGILAEIDGRRLAGDQLVADLYRIEAKVLLPHVLACASHP